MEIDHIDDLTAPEVRVLGCLIEKEATVPDTYPLTLNSLRTACNQATSRDPVVAYDDRDVEQALASLRARGLTRIVHSTSNRAMKYRHVLPDVLSLSPDETAVLAVLMLRGPQTAGELKTRTARLHEFDSTDAVAETLAGLAGRPDPLVLRLERQPGQKDARWVHLLSGSPDPLATTASDTAGSPPGPRDVTGDPDPYGAATAEFYELLATAHWERTGFELIDLLDGADPTAGPIVDVGSGTGIGIPYLLAAVPDARDARVHAIEPSKAMRTALHTRLLLDPNLLGKVTVDPRPLERALPDSACAMVLSAVIGHLADDECTALWRFIAERMPAGAPAVIELLPPHRAMTIPSTRYAAVPVGRFVYEGWQAGEPVDDRTMRWAMTYRVLDGDSETSDVVAEYEVTSRYRCWSPDDVRHAAEPYGLTVTDHANAVIVRPG